MYSHYFAKPLLALANPFSGADYKKKLLTPNLVINTIADLNIDTLKAHNIKILIFDVDNTLTTHLGESLHPSILDKFKALYNDNNFECFIFSNCDKKRHKDLEHRIFKDLIDKEKLILVPNDYKKPNKNGFEWVLKHKKCQAIKELKANECAMIGDRLLTDIIGANFNGLYSVKVHPFNHKEDTNIGLMRAIESKL